MSSLIKRLLLIALFVAIGAVLIHYFTRPQPIIVKLHSLDYGPVKATIANTRVGTVKACRRAYLAPQAGGQVTQLTVKEGSPVEKGQLLLAVWNLDVNTQITLQQANTATLSARIQEACALASGARRDAKRLQKLHKHEQLISEDKVDQALTRAQAKEAACIAAKAAITVNKAQIAAAQAALERTRLVAPFAGIVAEVNAELGEFVTPSPPGIPTLPAVDLLDISCLYVSAPIDEVDAPKIQLGMAAAVTLDAFPEQTVAGMVRRIAPYVLEKEKQARTVEVEIEITDPQQLSALLPGYSADIEVLLQNKPKVLRVPTAAVFEGNKLLLMDSKGYLQEQTFKPGLANWDFTEIISGLSANQSIVISVGQEGVKAGAYAMAETTAESQ